MRKKLRFIFSVYHYLLAFLGNILFGFPSRKKFILGVTGTKGKTSVLDLISFILEKAGYKTALISSEWIKIGNKKVKNLTDTTMPGRFFIQRFLRKAVNQNCDFILIEVTSQGIIQHRHRFINWNAAMFLNLAPEHIEAHGGFEKYKQAKLKFFTYVKNLSTIKHPTSNIKHPTSNIQHPTSNIKHPHRLFFINQDDLNAKHFIEAVKNQNTKIVLFSKDKIPSFLLSGSSFIFPENIAAARAFVKEVGISDKLIKEAIEKFPGTPGRMEVIQKEPFMVIIDYAHTPDSLKKAYQAIVNLRPEANGKLICLLGCAGGGRDKWKRPEMGKIAAKYCRQIILTNEDPYDESPFRILSDIKSGIPAKFPATNIYEILDRKKAIQKTLSLAKPGDIVILTGKGSESYIHINHKKIPWNESEIVKQELVKIISKP